MGSSAKPKPRGQPPVAMPPFRTSGGGSSAGGIPSPVQLVITLVRVDAKIASAATTGARVRKVITSTGVEVHLGSRRLGDVPPRFHETIREGYGHGVVQKVSQSPLQVVVVLVR